MNRITLPKNIDQITIDAINKAEKHKKVKRKKRNKIIAASITSFILLGTLGNENIISAVEKLKTNFEDFYDNFYFKAKLKPNSLSEYTTVVNKTVENSNIKVTLEDFYMDDESIYINTTIDGSKVNINPETIQGKIYLNGVYLDPYKYFGGYTVKNPNGNISNNLIVKRVKDLDLSKIQDIKVSFNEVGYFPRILDENGKEVKIEATKECEDKINKLMNEGKIDNGAPPIKGKWEFNFKHDPSNIKNKIKKYNINKEYNINGFKYKVNYVKVTPVMVMITYENDDINGDNYIKFGIKDKSLNIKENTTGVSAVKELGGHNSEFMINTEDLTEIELVPNILNKNSPNKDNYKEDFSVKIKL